MRVPRERMLSRPATPSPWPMSPRDGSAGPGVHHPERYRTTVRAVATGPPPRGFPGVSRARAASPGRRRLNGVPIHQRLIIAFMLALGPSLSDDGLFLRKKPAPRGQLRLQRGESGLEPGDGLGLDA